MVFKFTFQAQGSGFRLPASRSRVSGFGPWVSGIGYRGFGFSISDVVKVSGFGFQIPGSGFRVPGSGFWGLGVSRFEFRGSGVLDFMFEAPGSGFGILGSLFCVPSFGFQISGFGFRISGFRFRISGPGFRGPYFRFQVSVSGV